MKLMGSIIDSSKLGRMRVSEVMQNFSVRSAANSSMVTEATRQVIIVLEHTVGPLKVVSPSTSK